ncbi:MAG: dual specificity protein phosphatase family protein [Chloroflexota bacterium]
MAKEAFQQVTERLSQDAAFRDLFHRQPLAALQGYDLTDEERRNLILPNFSWLIDNELAGMSLPRTNDALALLPQLGVRAVVSLTEQPLPVASLTEYGIVAEHIPVPDFTAPTLDQLIRAVAAIERCRAGGRPTAVHCGAGLGRTGTILAGALVARGLPAAAAIARVRAARPGSVETPEQVAVVNQYERQRAERKTE